MCSACIEDELRNTEEDLIETEKKAAQYEKALSDILATAEAYRLFSGHMDLLTKTLVQDIAKDFAKIANKALEDADD